MAPRNATNAPAEAPHALLAGGEMGRLTRAYDWSRSPLGPPEGWPEALRTVVQLVLSSPQPMFIWWGADLIQFYNDAYAETMGPERHPSALGDRGRDCWAEIWDLIGPQIDQVMTQGLAVSDENRLVPVTRNGAREDVWWTYSYSPIPDRGAVGGVLVICADVTQTHLARTALADANARLLAEMERQKLLAGELHHRMKNGLAVIQALVNLTGRSAATVDEYRETLAARLQAMATTQDLFIEAESDELDLRGILEAELAPFKIGDRRADIHCPPLQASARAANGFTLIVHELLTNAVKYGALSTAEGRLSIDCAVTPDGARLTWRETCAAPVTPGKAGFGTTLIERIAADLGGKASLDFHPTGLHATITFRLG